MDCQEYGIDASAVFERERTEFFNDALQDEAFMPNSMQAWDIPADTTESLTYGEILPQPIQERQTYIPTNEILGFQAHIAETVEEQQEDWAQYIDFDGGDLGQKKPRLISTQTRRQRQTKNTPVFTADSRHKHKRRFRSHEHETLKKHHKRQKAQIPKEKMPGSVGQNIEEWIVLSQPIQKQGRNAYRTYACQELIAMQQSPQRLSMIARELAQEFDLDSTLEPESLGIEITQRRQRHREWTEKSRREHISIARGGCAPMMNNEQTPMTCGTTQLVPVEEGALSENGIGQSDGEEAQALKAPQNLSFEQTDNQSHVEIGLQEQLEIFHMNQEDYDSLDFEAIMNDAYAANQWVEAEQYGLPITGIMEDGDALL
ncbi:hypothetical protein MMC17_009130 [Xylographa soralifera]|nr:hypothetical protein [Xylographa soralifera]